MTAPNPFSKKRKLEDITQNPPQNGVNEVEMVDNEAKPDEAMIDTEDLKTTKNTITTKMGDLKTNMNLLDKALMELEDLKPACMDSGMSYKERVAKREHEIESHTCLLAY